MGGELAKPDIIAYNLKYPKALPGRLYRGHCRSAERKIMKKIWDGRRTEIRIVGQALGMRLAVYLLSLCILAMFGQYQTPITLSDFLSAWSRWDSPHYIDIAQYGYSGCIEDGQHLFLVFYPLLPLLLKILHVVIEDYRLCGVLLSAAGYAVGSLYFYKLAEKEYGEKAAENALLFISVFPFSFFFGSVLTEGIFFAVSAAFLYYMREHRWQVTAFLGFFACMTKVQGALLAAAVAVELLCAEKIVELLKERNFKAIWKRIILPGLLCSLMFLGLVVYLAINWYVEGDPFRFLYYQKNHWYNGFLPIWETIGYVAENAVKGAHTSVGMSIWMPELVLFFVWIVWICYGIYRKLRPSYLTYLTALFLITYSSSWLISGGRYTLCALPGFLLAGDWASRHEKWKMPLAAVSAMFMTLYLAGYLLGKQVM